MTDSVCLGVSLPTFAARAEDIPDIPEHARQVELAGLDAVWAGDHLSTGAPFLESTVALAAAAAVTSRIRLGFGVLLLAMRQQAWAAKQIGSLHHLSGRRVLLGVGVGGEKPGEWPPAGVPFAGRGARTDELLAALPDLLGGRDTPLRSVPGGPTVRLEPAVPMPPVWIGGVSERALCRAVEHGVGWLSSLLEPDELAVRTAALAELAAARGVPAPAVGTTLFAALSEDPADHARLVGFLCHLTGLPAERMERLVVSGSPARVAERVEEYMRAGAGTFVVNLSGAQRFAQYERLAEVRGLLDVKNV
ncbi:LLM class flavin-dependent oxidoreductase [Kutzneria viridogrisea]|uniref:Alkanesulfonate monooxygenase SsuD/methylene tetrahydromethanopterin reductase-like flavin-dependent oxidoreductase (Luciferase family) n=1 Tax=Kutzneria viridogrisea TaxID=47990 RepID=A0ABR6BJJ7_9PSEU|nr:alkanesulfonate monooxygenase SsuD/methylene tetrahydromethanopterin reductase-like flavin-dependent oxidoreductase (luciferase family) [Kutzneria viridogrisea]